MLLCEPPPLQSVTSVFYKGSFPQSLGILIKAVPKLVVCILQPEQALHQRC